MILYKLQSGDTLTVTKLDRITRSMTQGSELVNVFELAIIVIRCYQTGLYILSSFKALFCDKEKGS